MGNQVQGGGTKKDANERLNFTAFYEALLEAKGVSLGGGGSAFTSGRTAREPTPRLGIAPSPGASRCSTS